MTRPDGGPEYVDAAALRASFDYALNGILEAGPDGRIRACNPAAASILGQSRRRIVGATLGGLLAPGAQALPRWQRHLETIAEQGVSLVTLDLAGGDGRRVLEIASIDIGEGRQLHVLDDITEQRQLTESLEAARRAADEANAAKSAFLATMSHEIRTPLNGIVGLERLLRLSPLTPRQKEYLGDLRRAAQTLLALVGDVLDLSKIEAGRFELEPRAFDADEFLETVAASWGPAAADRAVRLVFDVEPEVPRRWHGDPLRLAQAVGNLLANAVKFTPSGRVVLAVSWTPSGPDSAAGELRLAVRDTGIGMTDAELARVFAPFVQADSSTTRRFGGTGLGLAIARGIVERMGGSIAATSRPGEGSEFVVRVPMAVDAAPAAPPVEGSRRAVVLTREPVGFRALRNLLAAESIVAEWAAPDGRDVTPGALVVVDDDPDARADPRGKPAGGRRVLQVIPGNGTRDDGVAGNAGDAGRAGGEGGEGASPGVVAVLRAPATPLRLRRALGELRSGVARTPVADDDPMAGLRGEYTGTTAMVVEDDAISRRVVAGLLAFAGIEVREAANGRAACEALLAPGAPGVQLVIMDVHMPEMDGWTAARTLRAAGFRAPIVALTAGVLPEERDACLQAGMSDWLPKPPALEDLEAVLARWLQPRGAARPDDPRAAATAATAAGIAAVSPVDFEAALARFLGDRRALDRALDAFVRTRRSEIEALAASLHRDEHAGVAETLHRIAGSALVLGAYEMAAAARTLEEAVRAGAPPPGLVDRLRAAFEAVAAAAPGADGASGRSSAS